MSATVFKRQGHYYTRLYHSGQEIWISLRTKDHHLAKLRRSILDGHLASATLETLERSGEARFMTREDMRKIVRRFVVETVEEGEKDRASRRRITESEREAIGLGLSDAFDTTSEQLRTNNLTPIAPTVDTLLTTHGLTLEKDSVEYRMFSRLVLQGRMEALKVEGARWDGKEEDVGGIENTSTRIEVTSSEPAARPDSQPLSDVITAYFKEHKREPRTDTQIKSGFERFLAVVGEGDKAAGGKKPIEDITKAHCRAYKEKLTGHGLSVGTVNKYLHNLSHLLAWAKGQGYVSDSWLNPADGLRIKKHRGDKRLKRSPFTDADLTTIFSSRQFLKQCSKRPERFWLPVCLLWTGARREEIAQLYLDDIRKQDGVWIFDIRANEERQQGLKNEASTRLVPVHSRLIKLGLLEYVEQTRATGALRVFPRLEHGDNGFGDVVGKYFGRLLRQLGIIDPGKVLHSLRHTVITRLHSRGVPQNIAEALVGHAANTVHGSVYVHRDGLPLSLLQKGIEALDFKAMTG
jgi:integrase